MPYVKRLNRVMQVPESEVERYLANGYKLYEPEEVRPTRMQPRPELETEKSEPEKPADESPRKGRPKAGE